MPRVHQSAREEETGPTAPSFLREVEPASALDGRPHRMTGASSSTFFVSASSYDELGGPQPPRQQQQQQQQCHFSSSRRPSTASAAAAAHRPGWRVRLWELLFPGEDAAGVEEAAAHYGHGVASSLYSDTLSTGRAGQRNAAVATGAMEPWHYMQVPLSKVILFLRLRQRLADQSMQAWIYAPFYVMLLLFVLLGPGRGSSQAIVDYDAVRRDSLAEAHDASRTREAVLLEAFRLDTENTVAPTVTSTYGDFVPGSSARYPWLYSWYNETVNVWTAPPDTRQAVDQQLTRIASTHHEPSFLSLSSIRTRRDVLRWLQLQCVPRLWNCKGQNYERSWRSTMTGGHHQLGAVRLISRRYKQEGRQSEDDTGRATENGSLGRTERTVQDDEVATPIVSNTRAAPPDIPEVICGPGNDPTAVAATPSFNFDKDVGGYVVLLPFTTSCNAVRGVVSMFETPKKCVSWPPSYRSSLEMREVWMGYTETDRAANTSISSSAKLCSSFIFDPAVSEVLLQYVEYGTKTNRYTVVEVRFAMTSRGAVVRPELSLYSLSALRWSFSFTPLALSISLALTILLYGNFLLRHMLTQYAARLYRIARPRRTRSQRLLCALHVLLHTQNLVHLLALVLAAAAVGSSWHTLSRLTSVSQSRYVERGEYPQRIDDVVRQAGVLLPQLCAGAVFFASVGLVRFARVTPGLWVSVQTIACSLPRLAIIFCVWMAVNVGMAMMSTLIYGSALNEFSFFGRSFTTLLFMYLDGGRSMMNAITVARHAGHDTVLPMDDSLPGVRGSRLGRLEPVPPGRPPVTLSVSNFALYPLFLLFFFYFAGVVVVVWGTSTIVEGYRNALLLPEAAMLPLWRGMWTLQFASTHVLSAEYAKETLRRLLLARDEAVMLRDMEYYLRLGYARAPAMTQQQQRPTKAAAAEKSSALYDDPAAAAETAASLPMVLWLLPRELQLEYGAAHLRRLCYLSVAALLAPQRDEKPTKAAQWRQHWAQQPSSLSSWLRASLPEDSTIEEQAARVGLQLEELPNSVVRYVEGRLQ